ncbi:MAG: (Fe-S)-binding protein [Methylovulum sp.]|nr:(Fe-S)-binding protein [Methylovulum sp.]
MFEPFDMDFNGSDSISLPLSPYIPDAGECSRCGMCISACPTFRLRQIHEETPRHRIRTISKILVENQPVTVEGRQHLDNCLQCRACEAICPSQMAYGALFDQTQALIKKNAPWQKKLAFWMIDNKAWRKRLLPLLAIYLKSGLQRFLRHSGLLKKLHLAEAEALLTLPAIKPLAEQYPTPYTKRGTVALFTGCLAEHFDRDTLQASIKLLNTIGYDVAIPSQQGCCGAIHLHNGASASSLINHNLKVFNTLETDAVLYTATACGAMLKDYGSDDNEAAQPFLQRLQDINSFLLQHWPDNLQLQPLDQHIAVHEPCSQRNVLKNQHSVYALLQKIPSLNVTPLPDNNICCGAGGSYMLTHPDNAGQLRTLKHQAITGSQADSVVSGNFGCMVFLNADDHHHIKHPLQLLAKQLPSSAN